MPHDQKRVALLEAVAEAAHPAGEIKETVEVWGYVHTDPKGMVGGAVFAKETDARRRAGQWGSTEYGPILGTVFHARIPLPTIPTVEAEVEAP